MDWLTRITGIDFRYVFKNGTPMAFGQGVGSVVVFASAFVFANYFPKHAYGEYQFIIAMAETIIVLSLTGFPRAITRAVAQGFDGTLMYAFKTNLKWSVVSVCVGALVSGYYFYNENNTLAIGIAVAALITPFINSAKYYDPHLVGQKRFRRSSLYMIIGNLIPSIALIGAVLMTQSVLMVVTAYYLAHGLTHMALFVITHKKTVRNTDIAPDTVSFAKHLSVINCIQRLASSLDKILLFHFIGSVALAEYLFAIALPRQFQHLMKGAKTIVLPKVSTLSLDHLRKHLPRKLLILLAMLIMPTVAYIAVAPYLYQFFFPQYLESIPYSQVYALLFLFLPVSIFTDVFIGHAQKHILYKINTITALSKIAMTAALVPFYGIWGVLVSTIAVNIVAGLLSVFYFFRLRKLPSE